MDSHTMRLALVSLILAVGCAHVPPSLVVSDRFGYDQAIGESWKRQTLMNVVRMHYADAPVFLEVASVINSYTLASAGEVSALIPEDPGLNTLGAGVSGSWSNTPTVTYQPIFGERFAKSLLKPISPSAIFQMMHAGWRVDIIFPIAVRSFNGLRNQRAGLPADPEFNRLLEALTRIQRSDAIGFRVEARDDREVVVMVIAREEADAIKEDAQLVRRLLGLAEGAEVDVTFGLVPRGDREVAVLTRSMLEILVELGFGIEVPPEHRHPSRVVNATGPTTSAGGLQPLVVIHSGASAPSDAYASVPYKGYQFWIDDTDVPSKRNFTLLMLLFSFAESGLVKATPVLTVGTGG